MSLPQEQRERESWQGYAALICLLVGFVASTAVNKFTTLGPPYPARTFLLFVVSSVVLGVIGITRRGSGNRLCAVISLSVCALLILKGF
jgi:hypothetical protein